VVSLIASRLARPGRYDLLVLAACAPPAIKPFLYGEDSERGDLRD
jgi:hypothetical protein